MDKHFYSDGLPYEDQSDLRTQVRSPLKKLLAWYVNKTFNGGLCEINRCVRQHLEHDPDAVVLDVGTGDGELFLWWARQIGSSHLYAVDAVPNPHTAQIQTVIAPLDMAWPFADNFFDVVISSQNIEHIIDTPLYLNEACRVLKPNGYLLVVTENLASWANIGALVLGWMPFSFTNMFGYSLGNKLVWHDSLPKQDISEFYQRKLWGCLGHQRLFTPLALRQMGERAGFRWEANIGGGYIPFWGWLSRLLSCGNVSHAHFIGVKLRKQSPTQ